MEIAHFFNTPWFLARHAFLPNVGKERVTKLYLERLRGRLFFISFRGIHITIIGLYKAEKYLTIIPRVRMGSESIAHEAEGRTGYWLRGHEGERNNCFSKIQLVGQKYRDKTTLAS